MQTLDSKAIPSLRAALALALACLALTGCGSRFSDFCNKAGECEGGNDKDVNACVAGSEGAADEAAAYECSDSFDKLVECIDKTGICKKQEYSTNCGDEAEALSSCEKAASGRK